MWLLQQRPTKGIEAIVGICAGNHDSDLGLRVEMETNEQSERCLGGELENTWSWVRWDWKRLNGLKGGCKIEAMMEHALKSLIQIWKKKASDVFFFILILILCDDYELAQVSTFLLNLYK